MKPHNIYDKQFRQQLRQFPQKHALELGIELDDDVEVVVKTNTKDVTYCIINNPRLDLNLISELTAAGGKISTAGTVGSLSSAATVSTACSTLLSASSSGSAGTASTGGSIQV